MLRFGFIKTIRNRLIDTADLLYLLMSEMAIPCLQAGVSQTKPFSNAMSSSPIQDNDVPQCQGLPAKIILFL